MKKKILSFLLILVLLIIAIINGTLAYFTDTYTKTNVLVSGSVKVELIEQQGNADGTGLVPYTGEKVLIPLVGNVQGEKYPNGQPKAANYIDKIVTVKNTGKSDAWIRVYFAIPSILNDGPDLLTPNLDVLHFDYGHESGATTFENQWKWLDVNSNKNCFVTVIDTVSYNVYFADYYVKLPAGDTTEQFISGVYLDKSFNLNEGDYYAYNQKINLSGLLDNQGNLKVNLPIKVVAVQAAGFSSVSNAVDEAFGLNYNPFVLP